MTAHADVVAGIVTAVIEIDAAPDTVFRALTSPDELAAWWGSDDTYRTFDWQVDLRPGGKWSCKARGADGGDISTVEGEYIAIDAPHMLEHTWKPSWENFIETRIHYTLEARETGTRVSIVHSGFQNNADASQGHAEGWTRVLAWLTTHLDGAASTF